MDTGPFNGSTSQISCGIFINELLSLVNNLTEITEEDILYYNLDRFSLKRITEKLRIKLEVELVGLLDEYTVKPQYELDCNQIAEELESYLSRKPEHSLDYVKSILFKTSKNVTSLSSILKTLLLLKDFNDVNRPTTPRSTKSILQTHAGSSKRVTISHDPLLDQSTSLSQSSSESNSGERTKSKESNATSPVQNGNSVSSSGIRRDITNTLEDFIVLDLLNVLRGSDGKYVKYDSRSNSFLLDKLVVVSVSIRQMINKVAYIGSLYLNVKNLKFPEGSVTNGLRNVIMKYLSEYTLLIDKITTSNEKITLRYLYSLVQYSYAKLRLLFLLNHKGDVINLIYDLSARGDAVARNLFNNLLNSSLAPYFDMIYKWIYFGELHDPHNEFFITINPSPNGPFILDESKLYKFFPLSLAESVHVTGQYAHYIRKLGVSEVNIKHGFDKLHVSSNLQHLEVLLLKLDNSRRLASLIINKCRFNNYMSKIKNLIEYSETFEDSSGDFEAIGMDEEGASTYAFHDVNLSSSPPFPFNLIIENRHQKVYKILGRLALILEDAVEVLNNSSYECIVNYKLHKGVLDLSSKYNKLNFYRLEMYNFVNTIKSSLYISHLVQEYISYLQDGKNISFEELKDKHEDFFGRIDIEKSIEVIRLVEEIIKFNKLVSNIFQDGIDNLNVITNSASSTMDVINYINKDVLSEVVIDSCFSIAEEFRYNVISLLEDDYYIIAYPTLNFNKFYKL